VGELLLITASNSYLDAATGVAPDCGYPAEVSLCFLTAWLVAHLVRAPPPPSSSPPPSLLPLLCPPFPVCQHRSSKVIYIHDRFLHNLAPVLAGVVGLGGQLFHTGVCFAFPLSWHCVCFLQAQREWRSLVHLLQCEAPLLLFQGFMFGALLRTSNLRQFHRCTVQW
jgi:hypothetical protein